MTSLTPLFLSLVVEPRLPQALLYPLIVGAKSPFRGSASEGGRVVNDDSGSKENLLVSKVSRFSVKQSDY